MLTNLGPMACGKKDNAVKFLEDIFHLYDDGSGDGSGEGSGDETTEAPITTTTVASTTTTAAPGIAPPNLGMFALADMISYPLSECVILGKYHQGGCIWSCIRDIIQILI